MLSTLGSPSGPSRLQLKLSQATFNAIALVAAVALLASALAGKRWAKSEYVRLSSDAATRSTGQARVAAAAAFLKHCDSLECLRTVHNISSPDAQFNFPHFMITGWPKSATTSLHSYFMRLPQIQGPRTKEPHFFMPEICRDFPPVCFNQTWREDVYVRDVLGTAHASLDAFTHATFEASTNYAGGGAQVACILRQELPWVKIVMSLREPISRAISNENMFALIPMLQNASCLLEGHTMLHCLHRYFRGGATNYSFPLSQWLEEFPPDQLFVVQFENLTGRAGMDVLHSLHAFLGLDPPRPGRDYLGFFNALKHAKHPAGWPFKREEYLALIQMVRPDALMLANLLEKHRLGNGQAWLDAWEAIWEDSLSKCDANGGECLIY